MNIQIPKFLYVIFPTFCTGLFILDAMGYDREVIYTYGWYISVVYFIMDFIVELLRFDLIYIFHHATCLTLLLLKLIWKDQQVYATFMHIGLTMEISNIFLNARPLLSRGTTASFVNDVLFVFSWFASRIFYSIPWTIKLVIFDGIDGGYPTLVKIAILAVIGLHIYWGYMILRKLYYLINPKAKAKET